MVVISAIKIVGSTNSQGVTLMKLVKKDEDARPFLIDEFFIIEDDLNNNPICRVLETILVNPDTSEYTKEAMDAYGLTSKEDIKHLYIAKASIQKEIFYPINRKANVRSPRFDEVKTLFYTCEPDEGIFLGAIRGTEDLFSTIPQNLNSRVCFLKEGRIVPQDRAPYSFDYRKLEQFPHIGLFGGSGSGKTFALKSIIEELTQKGLPLVVLDPHYEMSMEQIIPEIPQHLQFDFASRIETFYVGENIGIDFTKITSDALVDILKFSGDISQPMESAIHAIHENKETFSAFNSRLKMIMDAFQKAEASNGKVTDAVYKQYSNKIAGLSTLIAISWRLNELDRKGVFKSNSAKLEKCLQNQMTCIVRGPLSTLNIVGSYIINDLYDKRRQYIDAKAMGKDEEKFVPFFVIMDEAHSFAPSTNSFNSPMNRILETISKEGRKYGVFEILATQRPKLMNSTILAQLSTKFVFRTVDKNDIETIKRETSLDDASLQRLPFMDAGACFVSSAINGKCMSVKIRSNITKPKISLSPFDELKPLSMDDEFMEILEKYLPIQPTDYMNIISAYNTLTGKGLKYTEFTDKISKLVKEGKLKETGSKTLPVYEKGDV